jgi:OOP family OmpA-OmpF porin
MIAGDFDAMPIKNQISYSLLGGVCSLALVALLAGQAHAERGVEAGGFIGGHYFSDFNELGVADDSNEEGLDSAITFGLRAAVGIYRNFDLEAELAVAPTSPGDSDASVIALAYRAHALFHLGTDRIRPFVLIGVGGSSAISDDSEAFPNDTDFVFHGGVGVKYPVKGGWGARFDARLLMPPASDTNGLTTEAEVLLGFYKEFGFDEVVVLDTDDDGIRNRDDDCPDEAEDMDDFEDEDGCPEDQDTDGDGIFDELDECTDEKEDVDGFEDADGCPEADNDADGIEDAADRCPLVAEDVDGFKDDDGCPEADNDDDGIVDGEDKCPDEPETSNGFEDADGCPDEVPEAVKKFSGEIKGIRFLRGSAKIRSSSNSVLNAAAAVFLEFADLHFEIQGHTDNTGTAERNAELSQQRADSVRDYLISKGITADRITSKGYGQDVPVADNATAAGREANRRVEFTLVAAPTVATPIVPDATVPDATVPDTTVPDATVPDAKN